MKTARTRAGCSPSNPLSYASEHPIVFALPRGGVVVGYEVASALHAPLDVIVARKIGAPGYEELGIGAIAPGGARVLDEQAMHWLGISEVQLQRQIAKETEEMNRRLRLYRGGRPIPDVTNRTAILVNDGLATGVTARAAIQYLRAHNPARLVLAIPVCASETAARLETEVDDLVCVSMPPHFRAVGIWYRCFDQTTDQEVLDLLARAADQAAAATVIGPPLITQCERWLWMNPAIPRTAQERPVHIPFEGIELDGDLTLPENPLGVVLFAHGSGSSRHSPRNRFVARALNDAGFATLLMGSAHR